LSVRKCTSCNTETRLLQECW